MVHMGTLLRREAELHLKERVVEWSHLKNSGSTNTSLFAKSASGKSFTVKYKFICKAALQQKEIRALADAETKSVFPKLICSYISLVFPFHVCFITEWLEGKPLDITELNNNFAQLERSAAAAAQKLKAVHSVKTDSRLQSRSLKRDYRNAMRAIRAYRIDVPHLEEIINCIDNAVDDCILQETSYVHFDFHTGNLIQTDDDIRIIDLETISVAEAWRDLVYAAEIHVPEQHIFWYIFLTEYFDGSIPDQFFRISKIYVLVYMLMLAKQNRKHGWEMYLNLVNTVYMDYDQLRSDIPSWMIQTAAEYDRIGIK